MKILMATMGLDIGGGGTPIVGLAQEVKIGLDILRNRHRSLPPVGEVAQGSPGVENPVGGGDEGHLPLPAQGAAQKGGDAGVGVDKVGPLPLPGEAMSSTG